MDNPIALSQKTYDRFDRAASKIEQTTRLQNRALFQSPVVQYLKVTSGSTNSNGYRAYVQVTTDGGITWTDQSATAVRVRNADDSALTEGDYVHARFAGMNSGGEACFVVVGPTRSLEYDSAYLEPTDGGTPGTPTYTSAGSFFLDDWYQASQGSVSRVKFPTTGYWRVDVTLTGRLKISSNSGATARQGTLGAYLDGNIIAPGDIDGVMAGAYAVNAAGDYEAFGTCTLSGIYQISDVSDTGNIIVYGTIQLTAGSGTPTIEAFVHPITSGGVSEPQFTTWMLLTKLADL